MATEQVMCPLGHPMIDDQVENALHPGPTMYCPRCQAHFMRAASGRLLEVVTRHKE
jgi:hypothetical protein